jgi:hypothetical protein
VAASLVRQWTPGQGQRGLDGLPLLPPLLLLFLLLGVPGKEEGGRELGKKVSQE